MAEWRLGEFNFMSSQSHLSHCRVLPPGKFNGMSSESHVWWIHCHDSSATCHIAGCSHLAKSMSRSCHIAGCNNSIRHIENRLAIFYFFLFLMQFRLWRAAAFVSSPIHLLSLVSLSKTIIMILSSIHVTAKFQFIRRLDQFPPRSTIPAPSSLLCTFPPLRPFPLPSRWRPLPTAERPLTQLRSDNAMSSRVGCGVESRRHKRIWYILCPKTVSGICTKLYKAFVLKSGPKSNSTNGRYMRTDWTIGLCVIPTWLRLQLYCTFRQNADTGHRQIRNWLLLRVTLLSLMCLSESERRHLLANVMFTETDRQTDRQTRNTQ